jgi:hypothetical protein
MGLSCPAEPNLGLCLLAPEVALRSGSTRRTSSFSVRLVSVSLVADDEVILPERQHYIHLAIVGLLRIVRHRLPQRLWTSSGFLPSPSRQSAQSADSSDVDQGYGVKAIRVPAIPIKVGGQRRWRD